MDKFKVGQPVRLSRPVLTPEMTGAIGYIVSLPYCHNYLPHIDRYEVEYPGYTSGFGNCIWFSAEEMLDPIYDTDHRTKADEDELIFKPKKEVQQ